MAGKWSSDSTGKKLVSRLVYLTELHQFMAGKWSSDSTGKKLAVIKTEYRAHIHSFRNSASGLSAVSRGSSESGKNFICPTSDNHRVSEPASLKHLLHTWPEISRSRPSIKLSKSQWPTWRTANGLKLFRRTKVYHLALFQLVTNSDPPVGTVGSTRIDWRPEITADKLVLFRGDIDTSTDLISQDKTNQHDKQHKTWHERRAGAISGNVWSIPPEQPDMRDRRT
ncbi:hypothetical protein RRG08_009759 [Elysia crispata]|uniref:Uncharacterized protein n=1 Tax=Elysia crispata TaxID=231223 RepID=A0AAE0YYQ2_9GAST|nr:hypothetical protein RRG08_009759 [Elysia crispata]